MKRTITTLLIALCVMIANAQVSKTGVVLNGNMASKPMVQSLGKTQGDTLFYFNGMYFFVNPTDQPAFNMNIEDLDGNTTYNTGWPMAWGAWYDDAGDPAWWMPWDVDTAWWMGATSWFNPAGQADNWFEFGPITLPAVGADLNWYIKCNPAYRDGYKVKLSTTGMNNYTDFTDAPVYTRTDAYPSPTYEFDTVWQLVTVSIPASYLGQQTYFAFHHDANDMDVLWLDEVFICEGIAGMGENNTVTVFDNTPNPANESTVINYQLKNSSNVTIQVTDLTGRTVSSSNLGMQNAGIQNFTLNTSEMTQGIYFYSIIVDNNRVVKKMIIER